MKYANHGNYLNKIRHVLLSAGTQGISQHMLNQLTRTKIFQTDDLLEALNEWENRHWVQAFKVKGLSKHPKTMWRATTKLRDEWSNLIIDGELPTVAVDGATPDDEDPDFKKPVISLDRPEISLKDAS